MLQALCRPSLRRQLLSRRTYVLPPANKTQKKNLDVPVAAGLEPHQKKPKNNQHPRRRGPTRNGGIYSPKPYEQKETTAMAILGPSTRISQAEVMHPSETSVIPVAATTSMSRHSSTTASQPVFLVPPEEDPLLHFMSSMIMRSGKRSQANQRISRVLLHIHAMTRAPPLPIVQKAVNMVSPLCKTLHHKSPAGKVVSKPVPLSERQSKRQGIVWLLIASDRQDGVGVEERVAKEIVAIIQNDSPALAARVEAHKLATVNRGNVLKTRTTL